MPVRTAQQAYKNWIEAMNSGTTVQRYRDGINAMTENPAAKAAANADGWVAGVQNAKQAYVAGLSAVSLQQIKSAAIAKADRLASGANAAGPKQQAYYNRAQSVWQQSHDKARSMPKGGKSAAMDKVSANLDLMATLKKGAGSM